MARKKDYFLATMSDRLTHKQITTVDIFGLSPEFGFCDAVLEARAKAEKNHWYVYSVVRVHVT